MRILFLSDNYPPETNAPAIRTSEHVREWARLGHTIDVVTCAPNFPKGKLFEGYRNRLSTEEEGGIRTTRVWSYIAPNQGMFRRTLDFVSFAINGALRSLFLPKPDVVIATSPQFFTALAGFGVAKLRRVPFVFEVRDLWPESIAAVGALDLKWLRPFEALARFLYRRADLVVPVTDSFAAHLRRLGTAESRICVVTNGIDPDHLKIAAPASVRRCLGLSEDEFVCAYIGTLGLAHGLETILRAAAILTETDPQIRFLVMGEGADKDALRSEVDRLKLRSVSLLDGRTRTEALQVLNACDVSMVLLKDDPLFETVIPSKIFEAMALKKPIVIGVRGESKRIVVDEARCGIAFQPGDAEGLVSALRTLRDDASLRCDLGESGYRAVTTRFRRRDLARQMLEAVLSIRKDRTHSRDWSRRSP